MLVYVEKVLVDASSKVIGACVNMGGETKVLSRNEIVKFKRNYGNFSNAIITYNGFVKAKKGEKLQREELVNHEM